MKKIISLILITCICSFFLASAYTKEALHWYIKRQGRNAPIFPGESTAIDNLNAFYIDKSGDKVIYLTFDAGYENGNVEKILDVLRDKDVPAAFFLLDNIILKNTNLVLRMEDEGHLVCNHTKNHKDLSFSSRDEIERNIKALEVIYEEKCGRKMANYFRFPEGKYSMSALLAVNDLGYKTIFWSFAYDDWDNGRQPNEEKAIKKIIDNTHDGAVMLFHPTSATNAQILPTLIDKWREMGYSFGTLDDLTNK